MGLTQDLLNELTQEATVTRKYLASVPFDKATFQPHEKSETLGRLTIHVAEILGWWKECIQNESLNFMGFEPKDIQTTEELVAYFDELLAEATSALQNTSEDNLVEGTWSMCYGDIVYFTLPKKQALRIFCMNHLVHHRAQLGVYLRLLDIPIPAVYGPSADDENVLLIQPFPK